MMLGLLISPGLFAGLGLVASNPIVHFGAVAGASAAYVFGV